MTLADAYAYIEALSSSNTTYTHPTIVRLLEQLTYNLLDTLQTQSIILYSDTFIYAAIHPTTTNLTLANTTSIQIPQGLSDIAGYSILLWNTPTLYPQTLATPILTISAISATSATPLHIQNLTTPFLLTIPYTGSYNKTIECVYFDYSQTNWTTAGCTIRNRTSTHIICACNHLTDFAGRFANIGRENEALFQTAVTLFREHDIAFYIFFGVFFTALSIISVLVSVNNSTLSKRYAKRLSHFPEFTLLKYMTDTPTKFFIDRYNSDIPLTPSVHNEGIKIHPYRGLSYIQKLWLVWKKRIFYHHPYLSAFTTFDPRISKQMRTYILFIVILNTLFVSCLLYGYQIGSTPMTPLDSILLICQTLLINIPITHFFVYMARYVGVLEYKWRYPFLSEELELRFKFLHAIENATNAQLETSIAELYAHVNTKIQYTNLGVLSMDTGFKELNDILHVARTARILPDQTPLVLPYRGSGSGSDSSSSGSGSDSSSLVRPVTNSWIQHYLPVHTVYGWGALCIGGIYMTWCLLYIVLFAAYQSRSVNVFYNFIGTQLISLLVTQPILLFLTPVISQVLSDFLNGLSLPLICKSQTPTSIYFFEHEKEGLVSRFAYILFLRGVAEATSQTAMRQIMEIAVAPTVAIVEDLKHGSSVNASVDTETDTDASWRNRCINTLYLLHRIA
jgi:hypothetical protein